jgi:nitroimidazol reductase NimA-like FMN-containing flavoprotein (pyridoxamine 5'-phosphate oxidase superfamily)
MTNSERFRRLPVSQCLELLAAESVGRVGWNTTVGPQILPVSYALIDRRIVFRTTPDGPLTELSQAQQVAFEIDAFDRALRTGWSVLVRGQSAAATEPEDLFQLWNEADPVPWAPGHRNLFITITTDVITGRVLTRPPGGDSDDEDRMAR